MGVATYVLAFDSLCGATERVTKHLLAYTIGVFKLNYYSHF